MYLNVPGGPKIAPYIVHNAANILFCSFEINGSTCIYSEKSEKNIGSDLHSKRILSCLPHLDFYQSLNRICLVDTRIHSMLSLSFIASSF